MPQSFVSAMPLVIIESPYCEGDVEANIKYAKECMRDSLLQGEAPLASHLLYTQEGILDDRVPQQRSLGIRSGLAWARQAHMTVVYTDLGISPGMEIGIQNASHCGRNVIYRSLRGSSVG